MTCQSLGLPLFGLAAFRVVREAGLVGHALLLCGGYQTSARLAAVWA